MTLEEARDALLALVPPTARPGSVRLATEGTVARVVIDHEPARGAMTVRMMADLAGAVIALQRFDGSLVVVCGSDDTQSFCSGGHLGDLAEAITTTEAARTMSRAMTAVLDALLDLPVPSVAAIGGPALGGGAEIATACDFRVMSDESNIQFVQARLGIAPGWGATARLVRLLGRRKALRVLCALRPISPGEATEIGLADHRCAGPAVDGALAWLDELRTVPPASVRAVKRQLVARDPEQAVEAFAELWGGGGAPKSGGGVATVPSVSLLVLVVVGCGPKVALDGGGEPAPAAGSPAPPASSSVVAVVGPTDWSEPGGLCMAVPAGWAGTAAAPPAVLALDAEEGGVHLEVQVLAAGAAPAVDRPGLVLAFEDLASYRTVPLLAPSSLRSWQPVDPSGPVVMAWWNDVGGRAVVVEATFPNGRTTEGLDRAQPLLEALCIREGGLPR